jgi:aromatic amino acid aminotransferase I
MAPPAALDPQQMHASHDNDTLAFTIPDRLTVQTVAKRRAASAKLVAGVAAPADLNAFKVCASTDRSGPPDQF